MGDVWDENVRERGRGRKREREIEAGWGVTGRKLGILVVGNVQWWRDGYCNII